MYIPVVSWTISCTASTSPGPWNALNRAGKNLRLEVDLENKEDWISGRGWGGEQVQILKMRKLTEITHLEMTHAMFLHSLSISWNIPWIDWPHLRGRIWENAWKTVIVEIGSDISKNAKFVLTWEACGLSHMLSQHLLQCPMHPLQPFEVWVKMVGMRNGQNSVWRWHVKNAKIVLTWRAPDLNPTAPNISWGLLSMVKHCLRVDSKRQSLG